MSAVIAGRRDGFVNANATPTSVIRPLSCFITYDLFYGRLVLFHFLSCLRRVNRCPLYRVLLTVSQLLNHSNRYCLTVFCGRLLSGNSHGSLGFHKGLSLKLRFSCVCKYCSTVSLFQAGYC